MEFGIAFMGYPGCWEDAAFAEEHGFSFTGFVDSPVLSGDPFVWMGLTARATKTMKVGTFIHVPGMRLATVTAANLAAVNNVARGRVYFGVGTGYTGRLAFGFKGPVAASKLRENAAAVRDLLAGREVLERVANAEKRVRLKHPEDLRVDPDHPIPVYVAADGPKALQAAGEVGDGLIMTLQYAPGADARPATLANGLAAAGAAAAAVGRSFDGAYAIYHCVPCILDPGESAMSPRALAVAGPVAATVFHSYACNPEIADHLPPFLRERLDIYEQEVLSRFDCPRELLYQEIHAGHLTELIDGEAAALTEEIIRAIALVGTAAEIADQLRALEGAGMKNVTFTVPRRMVREVVVRVEEQVMPLMAASA